jgi:LexA-binding, inner membrane-associated putative hydrolase
MFLGHLAVGFASKRLAPEMRLAALLAAPILLDLTWAVLVLAGVETVRIVPGYTAASPLAFVAYPWSHSLVAALGWTIVAGVVAQRVTGRSRAGAVIAAGVASHWVLDLVSHAPDVPLWPGGPRYGFALWNSVPATVIVEGCLFAGAIVLYVLATPGRSRTGVTALWSFVAFAVATFAWILFGPPPPSGSAIAAMVLAEALFIPWALLIESRRTSGSPDVGR